MKTKISALMDGELDAREMREVCIALRHDGELRRTCSAYALIGDALRNEPHLATDLTSDVLDHLADEPVVLAPRNWTNVLPQDKRWYRPLAAMAATLAGVAVVAWLGQTAQPMQRLAMHKPAQAEPVVMATVSDADMQEYLIAHQLHSGSTYLDGGAQHIRTVSMNGAESDLR